MKMSDAMQFQVECLSTELVEMLMDRYGWGMKQALDELYASDTFKKICDPACGLYYEGAVYVFSYLQQELERKAQTDPSKLQNAKEAMYDKYEFPFLNACIKAFGKRFSLSRDQAYDYLKQHMGIAFLIEFYDVEHLQSIDDTVDDLVVICKKNGGTLG